MYKINSIGYIGLLITISIMLFSCKKEENKSASTGTPIVLTSELIGKYANIDTDGLTRDTIYIYYDGIDYKMTCPDNNAWNSQDTIGITISGLTLIIPNQYIYGTSVTIEGDGELVLSNQLNLNWVGSIGAIHTNVIYIKQ